MLDIRTQKICGYWGRKYVTFRNYHNKDDLLAEAYLGAWNCVILHPDKSGEHLYALITLHVRARIWKYIENDMKFRGPLTIEEKLEQVRSSFGVNTDVIDAKIKYESLDNRGKIIVSNIALGYTLTEIGEILNNVSRQRVHQLYKEITNCSQIGPEHHEDAL